MVVDQRRGVLEDEDVRELAALDHAEGLVDLAARLRPVEARHRAPLAHLALDPVGDLVDQLEGALLLVGLEEDECVGCPQQGP